MTQVFDAYARYYDLLYRDKDYAAEAEYVANVIHQHLPHAKRMLELGCGTGAHAEHLARVGYIVHGIDQSEAMLGRAEARKACLPAHIARQITFGAGDVRTVRTGETYDVVIALFHVMSYQATNADLDAVFETAAVHLGPGGVFLFDFWYGPAVLSQKPEVRVKRLEDEHIRVTRIAEPITHANENVVDVHYSVLIELKSTGRFEEIKETHRMRYLFVPEVTRLADSQKWATTKTFRWMDFQLLDLTDWSACALLVHR